jgi:putative copper export protein
MTPEGSLGLAAVRWLMVLSMAGLIGGLGLDLLVLPGTAELAPTRRRLRRWSGLWITGLAVAAVAELLLRSETMSGGGLAGAMTALPVVLARTHFGTLWIVRIVALGLAAVSARAASARGRAMALMAAVAVALTRSLTAHAADWGDLSLSVLADWLHILASAAWAGGLLGLGMVLGRSRREWSASALETVAHRFSRLAGACVVVVLLTGAYAVWVEVPAVPALSVTVYGRWLLVKLAFVVIVLALGAVNRYVLLPRLAVGDTRLRLFTVLGCESALAVIVFGCSAMLTEATPARHAYHLHVAPSGASERHDHSRPPGRN